MLIIQERIRPGSIVYSDGWKSYKTILQHGYTHQTVNHSYNFVDPTIQSHTQNIENLWWQVKRTLPSTHSSSDELYLHLAEYIWQKSKPVGSDLFIEFLTDAALYVSRNVLHNKYSDIKIHNYTIYLICHQLSILLDLLDALDYCDANWTLIFSS